MRGKMAAIVALTALASVAAAGHGDADPGGMSGRGGKGNSRGPVPPPDAPKPAYVNPFYPPAKPYPLSIQYPYYYYKTYPTYGAAGYPGAVYPVYASPGYVAVDQGEWIPGHWEQQWVPIYSTYQVWVPPYYDANGAWIPGRWEDRIAETGGYYQPVWIDGYWVR